MDSNKLTSTISQRVSDSFVTSGLSLNSLADRTGIPRTTLRRKLEGRAEFKISELIVIAPEVDGDLQAWLRDVVAEQNAAA